jgi:hypothetical protein
MVPSRRMGVRTPVNTSAHSHTKHGSAYFLCTHSAHALTLVSCQGISVRKLEFTVQTGYRVPVTKQKRQTANV